MVASLLIRAEKKEHQGNLCKRCEYAQTNRPITNSTFAVKNLGPGEKLDKAICRLILPIVCKRRRLAPILTLIRAINCRGVTWDHLISAGSRRGDQRFDLLSTFFVQNRTLTART